MSCEWLTVKEAAAYVKVTTHAIHRWIRTGRLSCSHTPGGERRICKADLIQSERVRPSMATIHKALDKESQ